MNKCKDGNINIATMVLNEYQRLPPEYYQRFPSTSFAASEREPLSSNIPAKQTKEWASPRKCIARPLPLVIFLKSFPQLDDTDNMQCKLCSSYFQDAPFNHPQFNTNNSRIIKTPNLSVIREQNYLATPVLDAV
jgi:hypothetical protein